MTGPTDQPVDLWNTSGLTISYHPGTAAYQAAVLEQWKMLVDTSERVSMRRSLTNTFFLAINSAAITVLSIFWNNGTIVVSAWWILLPLTILVFTCVSWTLLIQSYRRLNSAKFTIIHSLEECLPAKVFVAEWQIIQRRGKTKYVRFTAVEFMIPVLFAVIYVVGGFLLIATSS